MMSRSFGSSTCGRRVSALVVTALTLCHATLFAHDMWIEPMTFAPEPGEIIGVRLRVGQDLLGDPLPRDSGLVKQFVVEDAAGRKPVVGRDGGDPAGFVRAAMPGMLVIGYSSNPSAVDLAAGKFNQDANGEGLDEVAGEKARRKQRNSAGRELSSLCSESRVPSRSPTE